MVSFSGTEKVLINTDMMTFCPQIDFVAHDDIPYISAGSDDVYKHIKEAGRSEQLANTVN